MYVSPCLYLNDFLVHTGRWTPCDELVKIQVHVLKYQIEDQFMLKSAIN